MHLWVNYAKEEENKEVIHNDDGFIAYRIVGDEFFVTDFYVKKEKRSQGIALELAQRAEENAKEYGCNIMSCMITVSPHNKDNFSRKVYLFTKFGFEPRDCVNGSVLMYKEISREISKEDA